ncbi:P-loop containing nucleoside triphosphate hydrolase protein [Gigaspora margarita]|uniref:P-loop containing nucleoside triphosphate hydrolase protein n=1 Tax=Gigaspora margarita TaxID=4874 RepID=A0A8H4EP71_GIGMA|nr:P-loop containing nucleoside triphosphate hydrolase protein [Gigaspora margarita]
MDATYNTLAIYLAEKISNHPSHDRFLVAIAGIPGSGKSTLAKTLVERVNELVGKNVAIAVSMDGYHYPKKTLDTFPDPTEAYARRGAHWTFDAQGLLTLTEALRRPITDDQIITAPSYDHGKGDPVENDIKISPSHKLVILEGLYLHLKEPPIWRSIASQMHELWGLHIDREIAKKRIIKRHIQSHITETEEQAIFRVENNDMVNANYILENSLTPTRTVISVDEPAHTI